ncbi:hypothetical protein GOODEAATRI_006414 [Goodea atripinnis]|uniref:Uncharacterized protein n=1 Tax=Goodea atripinnis TaxID=208336 RepID=A0ABV0PLH9_9TELE
MYKREPEIKGLIWTNPICQVLIDQDEPSCLQLSVDGGMDQWRLYVCVCFGKRTRRDKGSQRCNVFHAFIYIKRAALRNFSSLKQRQQFPQTCMEKYSEPRCGNPNPCFSVWANNPRKIVL